MSKTYKLINLDCPVCANKIEKAIKKIKGISFASVSYINQKMIIEGEDLDNKHDLLLETCKKVDSNIEIE